MKKFSVAILVLACAFSINFISAQEALKSSEEEYYDFLSLSGILDRPTLGYRTLSDSVWNYNTAIKSDGTTYSLADSDENVWKGNNLGTMFAIWQPSTVSTNWYLSGIKQGIFCKLYGPDWYNSYNTAAPYGQNDGALWQGKGYNTSLTGGVRLEGYGLELTLKPQVCFQQNLEFQIMPSAYDSEWGYFRGYGNNIGIDCPQRFGDSPFWTFDWGDSELRYNWYTITAGFGTQSVWLGPAWLNPILSSNNAATFPKLDFGLRKTKIIIPWFNWYIGDIEARSYVGYLCESNYFDNDDTNNHNMINLFCFYYSPSFLPGFTIGANKVCLSKWGDNSWKYFNPLYDSNTEEDQKASVTIDWICKDAGIEVYGEGAIDDYLQVGLVYGLIRYPFDTFVYTAGMKKTVNIIPKLDIFGELFVEVTNCELPRNKQYSTYTFNMHSIISQGYTNKGQCIGTTLGLGGNLDLIGFRIYYPKGQTTFIAYRSNPDNTYSYSLINNYNNTYKANGVFSILTNYYIMPSLSINGSFTYDYIINATYFTYDNNGNIISTPDVTNFSFTLGAKYTY